MNCDIIRDLLPLYVDEVCSEAARQAVEEHLESCADCRRELDFMGGGEPEVIAEEVETVRAVEKVWKKGKLRSLILGLLLAAALFGLGYGLTEPNILPVSEDYLEIERVSRYEDGTIRLVLSVTDGKQHNFIRYRQVGGAFYITPMRPVIPRNESSDWVERKNTHVHTIGSAAVGSALYVGWGDDAILVWEQGMDIAEATPEEQAEYEVMHS